MSFNTNHINTIITSGNYEEFFILYIDNELSDAQMKMVDAFLIAHPNLQAEFTLLLNTKLPVEEFTINKEALLAGAIKLSTVEEDLLLLIDNELPVEKRKIIEHEIACNPKHLAHHRLLLKTRLDATEKIIYPGKEKLYRTTKKSIPDFKFWIRIAAAVFIIAAMGILYLMNQNSFSVQPPIAIKKQPATPENSTSLKQQGGPKLVLQQTPVSSYPVKNKKAHYQQSKNNLSNTDVKPLMQQANTTNNRDEVARIIPLKRNTTAIKTDLTTNAKAASFDASKEIINNSPVTSFLLQRTIIYATPATANSNDGERKGSFKGFLRKATRMIEKRTGIDATNYNDELLIGAVAIKLK